MNDQSVTMLNLRKDQIKPASLMLAQAFSDDPFMYFIFPERGGEDPRLAYSYEFALRLGLKYEHTYTTSSSLEGVAVWMRLQKPSFSLWKALSSGAILMSIRMGIKTGWRMQRFSRHLERKHKEMVSGIRWYLQLLGVDPERQGQGFASRLLRGILARIDKEGLPCYLETQLAENVPLYEHFGFKTLEEFPVPDTPVKMWLMLRPATKG